MGDLRVLPTLVQNAHEAMAFDESIFFHAIQKKSKIPILRFYRFSEKSITIGLSQRHAAFLTMVSEMGIPWTRRPTGGGMVIHENDLIFAVVAPSDLHPTFSQAKSSYKTFHGIFKKAFEEFHINTLLNQGGCKVEGMDPQLMICFERPICDDLMMGRRKIVGGAQRRSAGFLLHQGSIWMSGISNINPVDLARAVTQAFCSELTLDVSPSNPANSELATASELCEKKYRSLDWNWKVRDSNREIVRLS